MATGLYRNHSHCDFNDREFDLTRSRRKDRYDRKRDGEERDYLNRSYNPGKLSTGFQESERGDFLSFTKRRKLSPTLQNQNHGTKSRFIKKVQQPSPSPFDAKASVQRWSDDREPGELDMEEDEAPLAATIATSRWADVKDEEETVLNSRSTDSSVLTEIRSGEKALTTELCGGAYVDEDYMDVVDEKKFRTGESRDQTLSPQQTTNMLQASRSIDEFWGMKKISEGTYGVVYSARDRKTGEKVALKKVKMEKEREGFPLTSLREINIMLSLQHPSIVGVKEVVTSEDLNGIFMVMEYMDNDLKGLMESMKQPFCQSKVKYLMLQLLKGVEYLHDNWVLHRDLKTANLLLNSHDELKICDFGLSRQFGSQSKLYTQLVVTLWYRAPELLLGAKEYSTAIDMWSVGCIMAELLAKEPLFNGKSEVDQLHKIIRILGTPNEKIWPGFTKLPGGKVNFVKQPHNKLRDKFPPTNFFSGRPSLSEAGFDLLSKLLTYDPEQRITAKSALSHPWFRVCIGCTTVLMEEGFVPVFLLVLSELRHYMSSKGCFPEQGLIIETAYLCILDQ